MLAVHEIPVLVVATGEMNLQCAGRYGRIRRKNTAPLVAFNGIVT
jgi:hypothetical protein